MPLPLHVLLLGLLATATMDLLGNAARRWAGVAFPNYRLVGRWVGHLLRGRLRHRAIGAAGPVRAELALGWATHYAVGIAFAALWVALCGERWLRAPTLAPALAFGLATVVLPLFVMQPSMGLGLAARKSPDPRAARLRSGFNHALFGLGLFVAATVLRPLASP